jgi:hypothetical protein
MMSSGGLSISGLTYTGHQCCLQSNSDRLEVFAGDQASSGLKRIIGKPLTTLTVTPLGQAFVTNLPGTWDVCLLNIIGGRPVRAVGAKVPGILIPCFPVRRCHKIPLPESVPV